MHKPNRSQPFKIHVLLSGVLLFGACVPAQAIQFGHSRIESAPGQALTLQIPIRQISAEDTVNVRIHLASAEQWRAAGLEPPVPLDQLHLRLQRAEGQIRGVLISSTQPFSSAYADILLSIETAQGHELRHFSVLQSKAPAAALTVDSTAQSGQSASVHSLQVKAGDTLWSLARNNAPAGVTVYQWLQAVHQANPGAFIRGNIHALKQGVTLNIPAAEFMQGLNAQAAYQYFLAQGGVIAKSGATGSQASGAVSSAVSANDTASQGANRLQLSQTDLDNQKNKRTQLQHDLQDTGERISQLEETVHNLNLALQSQGNAATDLLVEGAEILGIPTDGDSPLAVLKSSGSTLAKPEQAQAATASELASSVSAGANTSNNTENKKAVSKVSWIQEHMLAVMGVLLALIVIIIAWVLRRANTSSRELDDTPAPVSEAMVREKLEQINLDLDQPPSDEPTPRG